MDLGISGRRALVCASSRGLGRGCATALAAEGIHVTLTGRDAESLAQELRRTSARPIQTSRSPKPLATSPGPKPAGKRHWRPVRSRISWLRTRRPTPGDFREWSREDWIKAIDANMLSPIELIRRVVDGMMARKFGRIVNITSASVKSPIPFLGLTNGARSGLTGFIAGLSRQIAGHNVTINGLLPGPFVTDRLRGMVGARAKAAGSDFNEAIRMLREQNPSGRLP